MEKAGIDYRGRNLSPHSFRHTLNTLLRSRGVSDINLRAAFGWAGEKTQEDYTHLNQEHLKEQAAIVETIFLENWYTCRLRAKHGLASYWATSKMWHILWHTSSRFRKEKPTSVAKEKQDEDFIPGHIRSNELISLRWKDWSKKWRDRLLKQVLNNALIIKKRLFLLDRFWLSF